MKFHVSVCSLIVFSTIGLHAGVEATLMAKALTVFDDNENPIEVIMDDIKQDIDLEIADSVKFYLYTRKNPHDHQELFPNNDEHLASTNYNTERPTCFITHGWTNSELSSSCTLVRDAYLEIDDVNVIVVDWSKITIGPYLRASQLVPNVAQQITKMIEYLADEHQMKFESTVLVGHSLGAHVMGLAAHNTKGTIASIAGLDPALPMFEYAGPGSRISTEDAKYVEIIHTNGGMMGYRDAIGHSDFYVNDGSSQPGCVADVIGACSHLRAPKYFAESINSKIGFHAKPCNSFEKFESGACNTKSTAIMGGYPLNSDHQGTYYLTTNAEQPYAKGIKY